MSYQITRASINENGGTYFIRDTEKKVTYRLIDSDNKALKGEVASLEDGRQFGYDLKTLHNQDGAKSFLVEALKDEFVQKSLSEVIGAQKDIGPFLKAGKRFGSFELRDLPHVDGGNYNQQSYGRVDTASWTIHDFSEKRWFGDTLQVTLSGGDTDPFISGMLEAAGANECLEDRKRFF